jgi:hypothetical protein
LREERWGSFEDLFGENCPIETEGNKANNDLL